MTKTMINFKTSPHIAKLIELEAQKRGYKTKSEFLTMAVMDALVGFEAVRHKDTLTDFLDLLPRITSQQKYQDVAGDLMNDLKALHRVYIKERLTHHMRLQKHLTDTAVQSYLQGDNIVEQTGYEGFIVQNCLVSIYDKLYANGIIEHEQWEELTQHYSMYLEHGEGAQLLQLTQQE